MNHNSVRRQRLAELFYVRPQKIGLIRHRPPRRSCARIRARFHFHDLVHSTRVSRRHDHPVADWFEHLHDLRVVRPLAESEPFRSLDRHRGELVDRAVRVYFTGTRESDRPYGAQRWAIEDAARSHHA